MHSEMFSDNRPANTSRGANLARKTQYLVLSKQHINSI